MTRPRFKKNTWLKGTENGPAVILLDPVKQGKRWKYLLRTTFPENLHFHAFEEDLKDATRMTFSELEQWMKNK